MSMLTELKLNIEFKKDIPGDMINFILDPSSHLNSWGDLIEGKTLPHSLFENLESRCLIGSSVIVTELDNGNWAYSCLVKVKNYDGILEEFLNWIAPYTIENEVSGTFHYCEWDNPSVISFKGGKFELIEPEEGNYSEI